MSELSNAIKAICEEKSLSYDSVLETIELALAAAYRKDFGQKNQNIKVKFNPETGDSKIFDVKTVVEDLPEEEDNSGETTDSREDVESSSKATADKEEKLDKKEDEEKGGEKESSSAEATADKEDEEERKFNPKTEIQISEAKLIKKDVELEEELRVELDAPEAYGRMAAQTAKQVIIQKLREAERDTIFNEFKDKEKEVVNGVVQRREGPMVLVDLGKAIGRLPAEEQIFSEKYNSGDRIKVYIKEVRSGAKGAFIILSRTSEEILRKIFFLEIPEISNELIELKAVAREAGSRSKAAVWTDADNIDPIGSCVGQRGARIQTIISELGGEKIDIIEYNENSEKFIANALSPAKILSISLSEDDKRAKVKVSSDQLSLAIGKNGQNARLAARLTGWKIDIEEDGGDKKDEEVKEDVESEKVEEVKEKKVKSQKSKVESKEEVKEESTSVKATEDEEVKEDKVESQESLSLKS